MVDHHAKKERSQVYDHTEKDQKNINMKLSKKKLHMIVNNKIKQ